MLGAGTGQCWFTELGYAHGECLLEQDLLSEGNTECCKCL